LRKLLYPVVGAASHEHVLKHGFPKEQVGEVCPVVGVQFSTFDRKVFHDEVKTMLCESIIGRLLTKFDLFIKGQSLFLMDGDGVSWMKLYGEYVSKKTTKLFKD
jgi:hypothetical protein